MNIKPFLEDPETFTNKAEKCLLIAQGVRDREARLAAAKPAPVAVAKPAPAKPAAPGLTTAAAFAKPQLTMLRSEWQNLSEKDKGRFFAEGGKLTEAPEPAKKLKDAAGNLTRAGFSALGPYEKNAYLAQGKKLVD